MSLTTRQLNDFKKVCEQYAQPEEIIEEELVHEICDELVEELVTEGYSEEDAIIIVEDAANDYIDEAKVTFGHDTQAKRASGAPVGARRRFAMRKAGDAVKKVGDAAKGAADRAVGTAKAAKAGAQIAGSIAKDEVRRAGRKAAHSATKAADAVKSAPGKARDKAKKGIKGFLKRQAEKVVKRMSEENVEEAMRPGERQRKMAAKRHDPYASSRDRGTAHNVAVRNDGPGTPGYEKKSTGGKGARYAGYGDQGAGNKARRRMGQEPLRGNTRKEELDALDERTRYAKETGKDFKTENPSEKGGTRTGDTAFDQVSREMRKTGGVMSSRGKAIQPQGKKKTPGAKGYKGVTPVDKIKGKLAQKRRAQEYNPYKPRMGESD